MSKDATAANVIEINRGRSGRRGPKVDWSQKDDRALVLGMADMDNDAWLEFERRWGPTLNKRLRFVLNSCGRRIRSNDTFEDIKSEVFVAFMRNGQSRLRAFDPKRGSLGSWVSLITQQVAIDQLGKLSRRPLPEDMETLTKMEDDRDGDVRGGRWVAEGI